VIDSSNLVARTFLKCAEWHDEVTSTNDLALERSSHPSLATPLLIGSTRQSAGRGRGTNRWWTGDGTLTFSVILDMPGLGLPQAGWPKFSLATALSVAECLTEFAPRATVGLKWPNDVWLDGRKICGILIEQSPHQASRVIVGIGLNVNTDFSDAPEELRTLGTSLFEVTGHSIAADEVLLSFLQAWERTIAAQRSGPFPLPELWSRHCVLRGHRVRVATAAGDLDGACCGIDENGALIVLNGDRIIPCYAGTVRRLS